MAHYFAPQENLERSRKRYDGRNMRGQMEERRYWDYSATILKSNDYLLYSNRNDDERLMLEPDYLYVKDMLPSYVHRDPAEFVLSRHGRSMRNKESSSPTASLVWFPDGHRLISASMDGQFVLWDGDTFKFSTLQLAHNSAVHSMCWNRNEIFLVSGDDKGEIRYWQNTLNNLKIVNRAHDFAVRGISFAPSDVKFASCSDDGLIKIWDFQTATVEHSFSEHNSDVRAIHWHPTNSIVASASKDHTVRLFDTRTASSISELKIHNDAVNDVQWNLNGNWLITASRDSSIKVIETRTMREFSTHRGHSDQVFVVRWHPFHECLFASGCGDGTIFFSLAGQETELGKLNAHDGMQVRHLAWHPLGHIIASGGTDHNTKFWVRQRPGDMMDSSFSQLETGAGAQAHTEFQLKKFTRDSTRPSSRDRSNHMSKGAENRSSSSSSSSSGHRHAYSYSSSGSSQATDSAPLGSRAYNSSHYQSSSSYHGAGSELGKRPAESQLAPLPPPLPPVPIELSAHLSQFTNASSSGSRLPSHPLPFLSAPPAPPPPPPPPLPPSLAGMPFSVTSSSNLIPPPGTPFPYNGLSSSSTSAQAPFLGFPHLSTFTSATNSVPFFPNGTGY